VSRREEIERAPWAGYHPKVRPLAADRDPWERQPGEGRVAYARFVLYRDMGPAERSLSKVAKQVGRSRAMMERLSVRWQWVFRSEQYDAHQERLRQETLRREQEEMLRRHAAVAALAIQKVLLRLRGGRDRIVTPEGQQQEVPVAALHPEHLDAQDLARLADVAVKIERLARGLPTEHAEITGKVSGPHEADDLARRILADPRASALLADLFATLARPDRPGPGAAGTGGMGDVREPGAVAIGPASGGGEPSAD